MIKDYFRLAYRGVRQRKIRSWLTMIGIFIGIAAVVALISLSQGLQKAIETQFVSLGSDKLVVQTAGFAFGPPGTGTANPLTIDDKESIEDANGIETVVGRLIRNVEADFKDEKKYVYAVSIPEDDEGMKLAIEANNYKVVQGRMIKSGDKYKVVLGNDVAYDFFDRNLEIRNRIEIQGQEFKVAGILKKTGNPQTDISFIMPEDALREILEIEDEYDIIAIKVEEGENIDMAAEGVKRELREFRDVEEGKEDFTVDTPGSILATLTNILNIVQGVLVGIASISLIVGGIGIMNTMYTAVLERTREIGIMKALGARREKILLLFLIESGILGMFGGMIGVALGMSIGLITEYIAFQIYGSYLIQAHFSPILIVSALLFAFLVGAASGVLPAKQAAEMHPVDALRK